MCISEVIDFRKGRGTRDQIANIHWIIKKAIGKEYVPDVSLSSVPTSPYQDISHQKQDLLMLTILEGKKNRSGWVGIRARPSIMLKTSQASFHFPLDSCWENSHFPKFILIAGVVSFLTVFLLLLSLWKLHR